MKKLLLAILLPIYLPLLLDAQIDTTVVVYFWKLDESFSNRIRSQVDTALTGYQLYKPSQRQYTGIATLGNYGLPTQSLVFTERSENLEFLPIYNFFPFMKHYTKTTFANTRKPYTQLAYYRGGSSQNKEEILHAFHTQNLTKKLNIGLHYSTVGSQGQYQFQKVKNNSFAFFGSFTGRIYNSHLSFNLNKIIADENGGVLNDSLVTDTTYNFTQDIPTLFSGVHNSSRHNPDVFNEIRNMNIFTVQELSIRRKPPVADSAGATRRTRLLYPKLIYIFSLDRSVRLFTDINPEVGLGSGLYPAVNVSNTLTADSLLHWNMLNAIRLQFQGRRGNHYFIDYSYELMHYAMNVQSDETASDEADSYWFITDVFKLPGLSYTNRLFNAYLSSGFNRIFANRLELNLYGRYYLSGYRSRDLELSGDVMITLGNPDKPVTLTAKASNSFKTPDFLYTHYASNNYLWTRSFNKVSRNHLSTNLTVSSKKFGVQGDYYLLRNMIFLDLQGFPDQYNNPLSILSLSAYKQFDFWKITNYSKLVYQKSENENVLDVPEIVLFNSAYLTHTFNFRSTGGKLTTMVGVDFWYNTKYFAEAYMPPLASFYRQQEKQLGNYPYFDVFLNVQLKRFRLYLKLEHFNSGWMNADYFSVLHYPRDRRDFKFGLSWTFYD